MAENNKGVEAPKGVLESQDIAPKPPNGPVDASEKRYISNGMRLIHDPKTREQVVKRLAGDDKEDITGLADQLVDTMNILDTRMGNEEGFEVTNTMRVKGATVFMSQLIEVGEAAKVLKIEEEGIKAATGMAVGKYLKEGLASGKIKEEELKALYKQIQDKNPDELVLFNPQETPGTEKSATKLAASSPRPAPAQAGPPTTPAPTTPPPPQGQGVLASAPTPQGGKV